jgi:hypothetical protein
LKFLSREKKEVMEIEEFFGLPDGKEVEEVLAQLHLHIETLGVNVSSAFLTIIRSRFTRIPRRRLRVGSPSRISTDI